MYMEEREKYRRERDIRHKKMKIEERERGGGDRYIEVRGDEVEETIKKKICE